MIEKKDILSIEFDDDNEGYEAFFKHLNEHQKRKKNEFLSEIEKAGDLYLRELNEKKRRKTIKASKQISYILKRSDNIYTKEELELYSFEDIENIYNEFRIKRRSLIIRIFRFLFDLS